MASGMNMGFNALLILCLVLVVLPSQVHAFGAGNIASISTVEGKNWRHGDIEDMLKTVAFIKGHKWTSTMIKRVYFGNWLRDYSQAMDVGTLKSVQADTIRILVWILSFMTFGYATAEFEVTSDRLGTYRPEEHIDNPKDYADNQDARQYDSRLRGPVRQIELDIDPDTGMKNYIANERGDWSTSSGYIKYSLARSIHYGRLYSRNGNEEDLCEALRCLGQGLHTLEDFAAHTNYCELALREMGFRNVFPHTGKRTEMKVRGHRVYPLVTGTFGMVDFFHSMLGEATDHFTQSEVNEMDIALGDAQSNTSSGSASALTALLGKVPGTRDLVNEAEELRRRSDEQESRNKSGGHRSSYSTRGSTRSRDDFDSGSSRGFGGEQSRSARADDSNQGSSGGLPDFDASQTIDQIYPILQFRDNVVRKLSSIIENIPGLETLVETITETLTVFVMSLLAPFVRPIINAASKQLQAGSSSVIDASGQHQYEPWTDPHCTDPTHSLLSKDHFSNILNEPAGQVASAILKYVAPRVLYAWENTNISERQVVEDCLKVFHHPALRDMRNEAHRTMYEAVESWVQSRPDRGSELDDILSAEGVKAGKNQTGEGGHSHGHGHSHSHAAQKPHSQSGQSQYRPPQQQEQQNLSSPFDQLSSLPIPGISKLSSAFSSFGLGGSSRSDETSQQTTPPPEPQYQQHHQSYHEVSHQRQDYESRHQGYQSHYSGGDYSSHKSHQHGNGGGKSADYYNESSSSHGYGDYSESQGHSQRRHHNSHQSHGDDQGYNSRYNLRSRESHRPDYREGYGSEYDQGSEQGYGQGYGGGYGSSGSRW
ncbi:heterokaryon incompatibility protein Het-C-domain-containing protein [Aspergillus pseudotamarii]|uniref:Heterokaryon incompatibility protein Het-C-domain-containing protein n=1 Tax=Aspergillus pseudotamarii TaxID=132259 RepID=A0A5N6T2W1_ASPPS|nr:heterokaryon incompatibility protein Het-C-domain-containing protein [Aspergillus pseudotamarii]KAE8140644.1 heterokaryon incompatibility protein Het-C-domain-containing protein [Aspergillus pseudotamarii]